MPLLGHRQLKSITQYSQLEVVVLLNTKFMLDRPS